jgi:hypothetical protein
MPRKLSQQAIEECVRELLSACRMPIKSGAVAEIVKQLAPQFKKLLDGDDGPQVWARTGPLMRDNGRFLGTWAEFIANRKGKARVEEDDVMAAFQIVREQCKALRAPTGVPQPLVYCSEPRLATAAEKAFLKSLLPSG